MSRMSRFCRRIRYSSRSSGPSNASRMTSSASGGMYRSCGICSSGCPCTTASGISCCCGATCGCIVGVASCAGSELICSEAIARYGPRRSARIRACRACDGGRRRERPGRAPLHAHQYRPGTVRAVADSRGGRLRAAFRWAADRSSGGRVSSAWTVRWVPCGSEADGPLVTAAYVARVSAGWRAVQRRCHAGMGAYNAGGPSGGLACGT